MKYLPRTVILKPKLPRKKNPLVIYDYSIGSGPGRLGIERVRARRTELPSALGDFDWRISGGGQHFRQYFVTEQQLVIMIDDFNKRRIILQIKTIYTTVLSEFQQRLKTKYVLNNQEYSQLQYILIQLPAVFQ